MDGKHPCEVGNKLGELVVGEIGHHNLTRPRVEDGVSDEGIPKEGIEELSFSDLFHACIVLYLRSGVKKFLGFLLGSKGAWTSRGGRTKGRRSES